MQAGELKRYTTEQMKFHDYTTLQRQNSKRKALQ